MMIGSGIGPSSSQLEMWRLLALMKDDCDDVDDVEQDNKGEDSNDGDDEDKDKDGYRDL